MSARCVTKGTRSSGLLLSLPQSSTRIATAHRLLATRSTRTSTGAPGQPSDPTPDINPSSRLSRYYPRLVQLSTRTGVPLPSLAISFFILHEITALVPVFLFFWLFQALGVGSGLLLWIKGQAGVDDTSTYAGLEGDISNKGEYKGISEGNQEAGWRGVVRGWYEEAEVKIGKIGSRYGVFGYEKRDRNQVSTSPTTFEGGIEEQVQGGREGEKGVSALMKKDGTTAGTVANAISAYIVVKALLPVRIAASIGLAPAFARFALNPIHRLYTRARRPRS